MITSGGPNEVLTYWKLSNLSDSIEHFHSQEQRKSPPSPLPPYPNFQQKSICLTAYFYAFGIFLMSESWWTNCVNVSRYFLIKSNCYFRIRCSRLESANTHVCRNIGISYQWIQNKYFMNVRWFFKRKFQYNVKRGGNMNLSNFNEAFRWKCFFWFSVFSVQHFVLYVQVVYYYDYYLLLFLLSNRNMQIYYVGSQSFNGTDSLLIRLVFASLKKTFREFQMQIV